MLTNYKSKSRISLLLELFSNWKHKYIKLYLERDQNSRIDAWRRTRLQYKSLLYWKLYYYQQSKLKLVIVSKSNANLKAYFSKWRLAASRRRLIFKTIAKSKLERIFRLWIKHTIKTKYLLSAQIVFQNDLLFEGISRMFNLWKRKTSWIVNVFNE